MDDGLTWFAFGMATMAALDHFVFPRLAHRWAASIRSHVRVR